MIFYACTRFFVQCFRYTKGCIYDKIYFKVNFGRRCYLNTMKITILSVSSQFIHASLAPWYLKAALGDSEDIMIVETSINEPYEQVISRIFDTHPRVLCVPCYIWNIQYVTSICRKFKLILPECDILLGGPEVSFRATDFIKNNPWATAVLCGEGEEILPQAVKQIGSFSDVDGIVYRKGGDICGNDTYRIVEDLSSIPSPYTDEMLKSLEGRLAYYESSRGCPFNCAYCLSSAFCGVRYFPIERVKQELLILSHAKVHTVKMVDRTFNANPARAKELLKFILKETGDVCFHLEVGADLFDEEFMELLLSAPPGKLRLEAGVQSTNPEVLSRVSRKTDLDKLCKNLKMLIACGNVCVHADLIFGLPGEDMSSCRKSFNDLYALNPHELQLGFLKLLHGSALKANGDLSGCVFSDEAPYSVIKTSELSVEEILKLYEFEDVFEKFYNSRRFCNTLEYILGFFPSPFELFTSLAEHASCKNLKFARLSASSLFEVFHGFASAISDVDDKKLSELLLIDYYSSVFTGRPPEFMEFSIEKNFRDRCFEYLQGIDIMCNFPHYGNISPKALYKLIRFVPTDEGVLIFDPALRSPVTGRIPYQKAEIPMQ